MLLQAGLRLRDTVLVAAPPRPIYADLVVGVISGLVAAGVVFGATRWWNSILIPWFEARVYHGLDVSGTWELRDQLDPEGEPEFNDRETIVLQQRAHRLSGKLTMVDRNTHNIRQRFVSGEVRDRMVCVTMSGDGRRELSYHSLLAEVETDGNTLAGEAVYYNLTDKTIKADRVIYIRRAV